MANAFLNTAGIVAALLPIALLPKASDPSRQTQIVFGVGPGHLTDGNVPSINVFNRYGQRMGQNKGKGKMGLSGGGIEDKAVTIDNTQTNNKGERPEHISIKMTQNDGVCLSSIVAMGGGTQWTWTGDVGYTCGAQWYASNYSMANSNIPMRCVWLDKDGSSGIIANGLSLHMRDFTGEIGLLGQYKEDERRLCQNSARMTFETNLHIDAFPKFFNPPLDYNRETNDGDPTKPYTAGALIMPDQGIDRTTRAYPEGTKLASRSFRAQDLHARRKNQIRGIKNLYHDRLTVSHHKRHSAKKLCEDKMSLGPDFVSKEEGLFCDMETAMLWPLCTIRQTSECFDMETQQINCGRSKRDAPLKRYAAIDEWKF